ncbi:MAG: AsmA family protein [Pseudomonadota bacterium]
MRRPLKILAIAAAAVLALLLLILAIVAATFDPNAYKGRAIALVQEKTGRTLAIPGQIKLTFFPKIGADLGKVSLSERNGGAEFAAVDGARVSLALLPLLSKRVVVDRIAIDGLRANLVRQADGSTNIDDLSGKHEDKAEAESSGAPMRFAIDSIKISNASLHVDDRQGGRTFALDHLNMASGEITSGVASELKLSADVALNKPAVKLALAFKSGFLFDLESKHYVLKDLDAHIEGAMAGFDKLAVHAAGGGELDLGQRSFGFDKLKLTLAAHKASQSIDAKLEAPAFKGALAAVTLPGLAIEFALADKGLDLKGAMNGAAAIDIEQQRFGALDLKVTLDGKKDGAAVAGKFTASAGADLKAGKASVALKGKLDDSNIDAHVGVRNLSAAALAYDFSLDVDSIDLARYQSKAPAAAASASSTSAGAAPESPIDLSFLKPLDAAGSIKVGTLKAAGMQASALSAQLRAQGGKLALAPVTAKLYGGSMNASVHLDFGASASTPRITINNSLAGIKLGPLLKDAIKKAPIDGSGDVDLSVTTTGATLSEMRHALAGTARLRLADGAVSGINLAQMVRDAKAKVGLAQGSRDGTSSASDKTDFSELSASLRIAAGVAHNEDLTAKTPLFRVAGAGDIDLVREQIDYLVKCTVVATLQGQGGPEVQALKGLTVPVRLSGPLAAIHWNIDFKSLATDAVKTKVQEGVKDKVKDALKGLFGR